MSPDPLILLRRVVLVSAAALLVWRIASLGLSAYYTESPRSSGESAAKALAWNRHSPLPSYRRALTLRNEDPKAAAALLTRAYAENPADVRPLIALAELAQTQGDLDRAEALLATAVKLAPANPWVHEQVAAYWIIRGDLEAAMRHWSIALEIDPQSKARLFPLLMRFAEDPRTRFAFKRFAESPPSWWEAFFADIAANAEELDTVRVLHTLRRQSEQAPVTETERKAFVASMIKRGQIAEAYVDWVSGLDREQRRHLGLLYDGGFELEPSQWGFGWHMHSRPRALVDLGTTFGVDGEQGLRIIFKDHQGPFDGVSQLLFLDPGRYRLSGRVATDSLDSAGGIQWRVQCLQPERQALAESERFLGANEWRDFNVEIEVPASCILQQLQLVSAGKTKFEQRITGGAWFDRMMIRKVTDGKRPAKAQADRVQPGGE